MFVRWDDLHHVHHGNFTDHIRVLDSRMHLWQWCNTGIMYE